MRLVRHLHATARRLSDFSHVIIGGGIVGTSIASELSTNHPNILLIEQHSHLGTETTSRNSEVIHGGIYYPVDSLKAKFCIEGKRLIYDGLHKGLYNSLQVHMKQCGKLIMAQNDEEVEVLHNINKLANQLEVETNFINHSTLKGTYPLLNAQLALNSPTTGIISVHDFLLYFQTQFENNQGTIAYNTKVIGLEYNATKENYTIYCQDNESQFEISSDIVINSSGLYAPKVSNYLLPQHRHYKAYFGKGTYYSYQPTGPRFKIDTLVYPCPNPNAASLGTHLTLDMGGQIKFGPDLEMLDIDLPEMIDYSPSIKNLTLAHKAVTRYLPHIKLEELIPSYAGVRPKIAPPSQGFLDFIIKEEEGFPGFINLLGIESPGVTSAWAIAKHVKNMVN